VRGPWNHDIKRRILWEIFGIFAGTGKAIVTGSWAEVQGGGHVKHQGTASYKRGRTEQGMGLSENLWFRGTGSTKELVLEEQ
jgi:hypothetical protein